MTPGRTAQLSVWRDGNEKNFSVTLGEQTGDGKAALSGRGNSAELLDGVRVETLTPESAPQFGLAAETKGVLVRRVDPDSTASQAGLRQGDVILEVNRHAVATVEQLKRYVNESDDSLLLFVNHDGHTRYVVITSK
jgi:serine protease Do